MATGLFINGYCYADADAITHLASQRPIGVQSGTTTYYSLYSHNGTNHLLDTYSSINNVTTLISSSTLTGFPVCDSDEKYIDTVIIGWSVVAVLVAAWGIKILQRAL